MVNYKQVTDKLTDWLESVISKDPKGIDSPYGMVLIKLEYIIKGDSKGDYMDLKSTNWTKIEKDRYDKIVKDCKELEKKVIKDPNFVFVSLNMEKINKARKNGHLTVKELGIDY